MMSVVMRFSAQVKEIAANHKEFNMRKSRQTQETSVNRKKFSYLTMTRKYPEEL